MRWPRGGLSRHRPFASAGQPVLAHDAGGDGPSSGVSQTLPAVAQVSLNPVPRQSISLSFSTKENFMPIIAWLLGVPLSVILILMLLGVF